MTAQLSGNNPAPGPTAIALMEAAERLFASKGIDGVSSREIAREAGQKNHSAVNYTFGSFEGLVEALIDYRATPVNRLRAQRLNALLDDNPLPPLEQLVDLMIRPLAEQLLVRSRQQSYINLLSQLLTRDVWRDLFMRNRSRSSSLQAIGQLADQQLGKTLPATVRQERLRLLGSHIVHCVAEWDALMRGGELPREPAELEWRIDDFVVYSVAGLTAATPARRS